MTRLIKTIKNIERKTFINGIFKGRFVGYLDPKKSDLSHEKFYNIEITEATVYAKKSQLSRWEIGEEKDFETINPFITKIPNQITLEIEEEGGVKNIYHINYQEVKLKEIDLFNQVYDQNVVLGEITAQASGYISHFEEVEEFTNVAEEKTTNQETLVPATGGVPSVKTTQRTGSSNTKGAYKRYEYYNTDKSTYWGKWQRVGRSRSSSIWSGASGFLQIIAALLYFVPLLLLGWQVILPLAIIFGLFWLGSFLLPILFGLWKWLSRLIGFALFLLFGIGLLSALSELGNTYTTPVETVTPNLDPVPRPIPNLDPTGNNEIAHKITWYDYGLNKYESTLAVSSSDFQKSTSIRNTLQLRSNSDQGYNQMLSILYQTDMSKLDKVYAAFDDLKSRFYLNEFEFAEVITSCIQYLEYNLVLDGPCDPLYYNSSFISDYLNEGKPCVANKRFGILSPVEYIGDLRGDCDTRTLLLFTLLSHYGYDVAIFGSTVYSHSVLGISGPYSGSYKRINGKKYYLWETTAKNQKPGVISREWSNINYWEVNLISKNINL